MTNAGSPLIDSKPFTFLRSEMSSACNLITVNGLSASCTSGFSITLSIAAQFLHHVAQQSTSTGRGKDLRLETRDEGCETETKGEAASSPLVMDNPSLFRSGEDAASPLLKSYVLSLIARFTGFGVIPCSLLYAICFSRCPFVILKRSRIASV